MKQFLCLKNNQPWYQDFKIGKIYTGDEGVIEDDHRCDWRAGELLEDGIVKPIETFEKDGHTWIRHGGGKCPVPMGFRGRVLWDDGEDLFWENLDLAELRGWDRGNITAYRIISTGEPETEEVELHLSGNDDFSSPWESFWSIARQILEEEGKDAKVRFSSSPLETEQFRDWTVYTDSGYTEQMRDWTTDSCEGPEKFDVSMDNWKDVSERDYRQPSPQEAAYAEKMKTAHHALFYALLIGLAFCGALYTGGIR